MKFIIATPVFNGMPALRRCIGSVRGQVLPQAELPVDGCQLLVDGDSQRTYQQINPSTSSLKPLTLALQVNHIIQDGGSTDGSVEFLKEFVSNVENETLNVEDGSSPNPNNDHSSTYQLSFASEADKGMYDAINKAWEKGIEIVDSEKSDVGSGGAHSTFNNSQSTILSWLNSDEQYLPGTLQKVATFFESHPDVDMVCGNYLIVNSSGQPVAARRDIPLRKSYITNGFLYAASCTLFYRRRLWDEGLLKLDTQYRYSSDADLVLRLLSAGVKCARVPEYLALFEVEAGRNLSFSDAMNVESAVIKRKYGAFESPAVRKLIMLGRHLERMARGCYRKNSVCFDYAETEQPAYQKISAEKLGSRFTYDRFTESYGDKK